LTAWSTATNYLGIDNFNCDCTLSFGSPNVPRRFVFRSEPIVLGVAADGASYGILRRGDLITHVDGQSILTTEGARRFAGIEPGDDVNLTIKRDGKAMKVAIRATDRPSHSWSTPEASGSYSSTWDYPATPPTAPRAPLAATIPRVWAGVVPARPAQPTPAPMAIPAVPSTSVWVPAVPESPASPRGWFGFSIRCNDCGWSRSGDDESPIWESEEAPELSMVAAESPAGRAGFKAGDRLTHIDGLSILSREGARKFGAVVPGQKVRLTVKRGNTTMTRELVLGTRPEYRAAIAATVPRAPTTPAPPSMRRELRYSGTLDNVIVEVWSPGGPSIEKTGDTMVITVGASVVRIKIDPNKRD
jgi:membrane-associated protease RseP (regulator of RpoE activity)